MSRLRTYSLIIALSLAAGMITGACGRKGDLYLPDKPTNQQPAKR